MELELRIERLGAKGDGLAEGPDGPLFVPFALPGERVRVAVDVRHRPCRPARGARSRAPTASSRSAPISAFAAAVRSSIWKPSAYLAWKRELVVTALRSRGLDAEVDDVRAVPLGSRRRAALALGRGKDGAALGYRRARSHELIDVTVCPVLIPRIVAACRG